MAYNVYGDIRSARALKAGATKRQVSVIIGDSTTDHDAGSVGASTHGGNGGGWMWGVAKALSDLHGIWGSFIHPRRGSSATPVGPWVHSAFQVAGAATGAPAEVEADITVVQDVDVGSNGNRVMTVYEYLGAGTSSSSNAQTRITVSTLHPRRASGATMKGVLEWYSADSGSGTFRLELRNISPFSQLALSSAISTNTGAVERHVASVTGTDSNTSSDVSLWLNSATGPVTFGRAGIVWPNQTVGHTVFPLAKFGGRPSVTMLRHLQLAGARRIAAALRLAMDEAGPDADLFVWVSQGFNNPNYHTASAGPASSTGTLVSATSTTVTLPASEGTADHLGKVITITGGTGGPGSSQQESAAQTRLITAYDTGTRVATLESAWTSTPDSTSTYRIGWSDSSANGYEDDMLGVMALFEEAMQILGRSVEHVHFILIPPTLTKTNNPGSVPELSYSGSRERALYLANNRDRVLAPDWLSLVPLRTMVDRGDHYSWPSDSIHLKSTANAGFAPMAETLVDAIIDYADSGADVGALSDTALAQIIEAIAASSAIDTQQQANVQAALTAQGVTTARMATLPTTGTVSTLTAADVWEAGTRTITGGTVQATLGGETVAEIAAALGSQANLNVYVPASGSTIDVYKGDAYSNDAGTGRRITITKAASETHWPTTLSTVHFTCTPTARTLEDHPDATGLEDVACTVTTATGDGQAFYLELTDEQTATLTAGVGAYEFWFVANVSTAPATLRSGSMTARRGASG